MDSTDKTIPTQKEVKEALAPEMTAEEKEIALRLYPAIEKKIRAELEADYAKKLQEQVTVLAADNETEVEKDLTLIEIACVYDENEQLRQENEQLRQELKRLQENINVSIKAIVDAYDLKLQEKQSGR